MKLAISNIAWQIEEEEVIADLMRNYGICGVEVAPTKKWPKPLETPDKEILQYRKFWEKRDIQIVAMQALLYGRQDLTIFQNNEARNKTFEYLKGIIKLGAKLGVKVLVFGSPQNRKVNSLSETEIEEIAIPFFRNVGNEAVEHKIVFCVEPNPVSYGCDFINTSSQGLALVRKVNSSGFGLHIDAGSLTLNNEPLEVSIRNCADNICHFHASEPNLGPLGNGTSDHVLIASILSKVNYKNWVSVEMRHNPDMESKIEIERVINFLKRTYKE